MASEHRPEYQEVPDWIVRCNMTPLMRRRIASASARRWSSSGLLAAAKSLSWPEILGTTLSGARTPSFAICGQPMRPMGFPRVPPPSMSA